jgi:hypothetical protein
MARLSAFRRVPQTEILGEAKDSGLGRCLTSGGHIDEECATGGLAKVRTNLT